MTVANGASDETPQAGSGIGFGTVVRLLTIALGIMSWFELMPREIARNAPTFRALVRHRRSRFAIPVRDRL